MKKAKTASIKKLLTKVAPISLRKQKGEGGNLSSQRLMLLLAFVIGVLTALAGLLLKWFIGVIEHLLTHRFSITDANWPYLIYPVIGIFLTGLFVRYVVRDDIGHGITKILYAIARKQSRIKPHNTWSSVVASGITIGFGGSVGAEAPIVLTGSAIGSCFGQLFHLDSKKMMLLVGCGAAGAVSGIFKAPIAGLVFTLEVLMIDFTLGSLLPLLVSCVTAAAVTFAFSGTGNLFEFHLVNAFAIERVPAYILLGIFCGLISLYFTRVMNWLEDQFRRLGSPWRRFLVAGPILSILIFLFPSLYGERYGMIRLLLNGQGPMTGIRCLRAHSSMQRPISCYSTLPASFFSRSLPLRPPIAEEVAVEPLHHPCSSAVFRASFSPACGTCFLSSISRSPFSIPCLRTISHCSEWQG